MKEYAFPKKFRLLRRDDYVRVQGSDGRLGGRWVVVLYTPNDLGHSRIGITVSKKVGKAVIRSRVKRLIRESVRLNMPRVRGLSMDMVFIARRKAAGVSFHEMFQDISRLISRLERAGER